VYDKGPTKLLVLFPGALGDFVCFLPALERLTQQTEVELLARSEFSGLVSENLSVRSLERYEIYRLYLPNAKDDERVQIFFRHYDSIYSWSGYSESMVHQNLRTLVRDVHMFPFRPKDVSRHISDYYLTCIGEPSSGVYPQIVLKPDDTKWAQGFWRQARLEGAEVLALAPGSGAREKNWPKEFFLDIAERWKNDFGRKVLVIAGEVEAERGELEFFQDRAPIAFNPSLSRLSALLRRSAVYAGNDSGITHLAAALKVPTIAIFGPTDTQQWAPRGPRIAIVREPVECSPCTTHVMKSCAHHQCLTGILPDKVWCEITAILASNRTANGNFAP